MKIGIVGSEAAKFTRQTEGLAKHAMLRLLRERGATAVVSGECHLGGIDAWAKEAAAFLTLPFIGFPPAVLSWTDGYKPRNLRIAQASDECYCITVETLPPTYTGMRFPRCYHCGSTTHVKSGGCWTVKQAQRLGKPGAIIVVSLP